uniref:Secreted protein n=1 Tax=Oryza brachyantha TaxID=4533 RepID=J3LHW2_ORYBR
MERIWLTLLLIQFQMFLANHLMKWQWGGRTWPVRARGLSRSGPGLIWLNFVVAAARGPRDCSGRVPEEARFPPARVDGPIRHTSFFRVTHLTLSSYQNNFVFLL